MSTQRRAVEAVRGFIQGKGRWIGVAASLIALAAFCDAFVGILSVPQTGAMLGMHWSALLGAFGLYVTAYVPMSLAWLVLANACGAPSSSRSLVRIFLVSQIGKYLPGNVGHLIGRAYLAHQNGVPFAVTGTAMGLEAAGVLVAGAFLAAVAGLMAPDLGAYAVVPLGAVTLAAGLSAGLFFVLRRPAIDLRGLKGPLIVALSCYLVVFILLASANLAILEAVHCTATRFLALRVVGAVVLSWLVGFMAPGAPAGLGLREISFYALLADAYPESTVLFAAVGMRLATTVGDGVAWLGGMAIGRVADGTRPKSGMNSKLDDGNVFADKAIPTIPTDRF